MTRFVLTAVSLALLAGCIQTPENARVEPDTPGGCPAGAYQSAVGQVIDDVTFDWPADKLRIVSTGQAVTTDFVPDRMTVTYGRDRRILLVTCG